MSASPLPARMADPGRRHRWGQKLLESAMSVDVRLLVLLLSGIAGVAWSAADEPVPDPAPRRLHCKAFETSLDGELDTRDRATPLGLWVSDREARGWKVESVDFEVAQKPTGFAQGWTQVCLSPI